ncbi:MAG: hypothetical protein EBS74_10180, partial [Flavobacteriia bacterium]|nr:hypothetical protein [Flavobacteriia bacterium]
VKGVYKSLTRREELARIRRQEQTQAGKILGVENITFLGKMDGSVFPTLE